MAQRYSFFSSGFRGPDDGQPFGGLGAAILSSRRVVTSAGQRHSLDPSHIRACSRISLLAPDIVEAVLNGKQGSEVTLARVLEPFPNEWAMQVALLRMT